MTAAHNEFELFKNMQKNSPKFINFPSNPRPSNNINLYFQLLCSFISYILSEFIKYAKNCQSAVDSLEYKFFMFMAMKCTAHRDTLKEIGDIIFTFKITGLRGVFGSLI